MKTIHIFLLLMFFANTNVLSQASDKLKEQPPIVPATPNATKMTEYYAQRPNMYTGTANVTIPLYTIDFEGWKLPLSISYNATGVRTNEEATEVGLGWSLNATAVISRSINGGDDLFPGNIMNGKLGYCYDPKPIVFNRKTYKLFFDERDDPTVAPEDTSYYLYLAQNGPDTQPDLFNYNFFGYSGTFVLSKKITPSTTIEVLKITDDACSIKFNEKDQTFTIITPQGFKGTFSVKERSTTFSSRVPSGTTPEKWLSCCDAQYIDLQQSLNFSSQFRAISSWYVSEVISPHGKVLTFKYDTGEAGRSFHSLTRSMGEFEKPESPRVCIQTVHEHTYLSRIESKELLITFTMESRDDIRMNTLFTLAQNPGYPFPTAIKLKRYNLIRIKGLDPASTLDRNITFVHNYFDQNYHNKTLDTEDEVRYLRSRLDRVRIDDQEYSFYYRNPDRLPDKLTTAVDHFGFYNGVEQVNRMLLPPIPMPGETFSDPAGSRRMARNLPKQYQSRYTRLVDPSFGFNGILIKVRYPTGGFTEFEYEPHRYIPERSIPFKEALSDPRGNLAGGARIRSIKDYSVESVLALRKEYFYNQDHLDNSSASAGRMMTPLYNRYECLLRDGSDGIKYFYRTHAGIPGSSAAQGKIIGYTIVNEIVYGDNDSYRNRYTFENRPNKVGDFNMTAAGYPNLNGQSIETRNYDNGGKIVQQIVDDDYFKVFGEITGIVYEQYDPPSYFMGFHSAYILDRTFITPHVTVTTVASFPGGIITDKNDSIISFGTSQRIKTTRQFNEKRQLYKSSIANSVGQTLTTEYKRPWDYPNRSAILRRMINPDTNLIGAVIEEKIWRNNKLISAKANLYGKDGSNHINLVSNFVWNPTLGKLPTNNNGGSFSSPYELTRTFNKYDSEGNLLEYTSRDGIANFFTWGYNNALPVAHKFGSASAGLVTEYSHNPLVGVSSTTDPNGIKTTYSYGRLARLESVSDNEGNILEQYQFHLREKQPVRLLTLSTASLDFGQQVIDYFASTFLEYEKCGDNKRKFVLSNEGEDDLAVQSMSLPPGYTANWNGGTVNAGTSIEITITFNTLGNLAPGTYNGAIGFLSNKTSGVSSMNIKATLISRVCSVVPNQTTIDFGKTISSFQSKPLVVTNNGVGAIRIIGTPLGWKGIGSNYSDFRHPDFSVESNPACILPSQSQTLTVAFIPKGIGPTQTVLSLVNDSGCPETNITLKGNRRPPSETIMMSISSPLQITPVGTDTTVQLKVANDGVYQLNVSGVTMSGADASKFRISPTVFNVDPGREQVFNVSFSTTQLDFAQRNLTLAFRSNATNVANGEITRTLAVKRQLRMALGFSSGSAALTTTQPLVFTTANQQKTITIANTGNNTETITGLYFSPTNPNGQEYPSSEWWQLVGSPPINATLGPQETRSITVRLSSSPSPVSQLLSFKFMSVVGGQSFTSTRSIALKPDIKVAPVEVVDVVDLTNKWSLTYSQNPITNQLKNDGTVALRIDAIDFDTRSGQISYAIQIGSTEYTIAQLLQTRPIITAQSTFMIKISASSFQTGASDIIRIKFYKADDPNRAIVKTLIKTVSKQLR